MTRAKSIIGALALCALALALGILGAASASATVSGLTAVTCTEAAVIETGDYKTNECLTPKVEKGNFVTKAIPEGTPGTQVVKTGVDPSFEMTLSLVKSIITCEKSVGTGRVTNKTEGEFMRAHGTETVLAYENCDARQSKNTTAVEQCEVKDKATGVANTIKTFKLTSTTTADHTVTVSPEAGGNFVEFEITGKALNGKQCKMPAGLVVTMTGSVNGVANTEKHNHLTFTAATNGTNTKANGAIMSYTATEVGYMDEGPGKEHGAPVGLTTATEF